MGIFSTSDSVRNTGNETKRADVKIFKYRNQVFDCDLIIHSSIVLVWFAEFSIHRIHDDVGWSDINLLNKLSQTAVVQISGRYLLVKYFA